MIKKIALFISPFFLAVLALIIWVYTLLGSNIDRSHLPHTTPDKLTYLDNSVKEQRGKILTVVTSETELGDTGKETGYELTELSRAYYVFTANGFEVDIASPKGGRPNAIIDEGLNEFDYAFLNDPIAQKKAENTLNLNKVNPNEYSAIYFVGGKGTMFDFPNNITIQNIVKSYYENNKVIGAVCHGPAALLNVTLDDGSFLLAGKQVTSFTNAEELLIIPTAKEIFPFLLEDKLTERGAHFHEAPLYVENMRWDGNIITGQNPWSVWTTAEAMIQQLGYEPIPREKTVEENSIEIVKLYYTKGYHTAEDALLKLVAEDQHVSNNILVLHGIVAAWQWKISSALQLFKLAEVIN